MPIVKSSRRPARIAFPSFTGLDSLPSLDEMENRMNRLMRETLGDRFDLALTEPIGWMPAMDIVETDKELTVTAELPGIDQKDIDVSLDNGVLSIRGEKTDEREREDKKVHLYERSYGSFQRSFTLPSNVEAAKISAEFEKGVLKIHLPKDGEAKPKGRKIAIKTT
jgi:HSP20 family protein